MQTSDEYFDSIHRFGRISMIGTLLIMFAIPVVISLTFHTFPGVLPILKASVGLLAIFIPIGISEILSYTPILGSSSYLTFITGNILNLKLPVATNAQAIANVESGTEKSDVITTIAVSVSSILTIILIAIGALLLVPLKPILSASAVKTAIQYILPSLFGGLGLGILGRNVGGGITVKGRLWGALLPTILVAAVYFISAKLVTQLQGVFIIICLPITFFGTKFLYKKGKITVTLPGKAENEVKE